MEFSKNAVSVHYFDQSLHVFTVSSWFGSVCAFLSLYFLPGPFYWHIDSFVVSHDPCISVMSVVTSFNFNLLI